MTGFEVYKLYLALKLHFNTDYNYFQFNGQTKASEEKFEKRKDRFYFKRLAEYYTEPEIIGFFLSHLLDNPNFWIGSMGVSIHSKIYTEWKRKIESLFVIFCEDVDHLVNLKPDIDSWFKIESGDTHPFIIKEYFAGRICLETVVIIETLLQFVENIDSSISDGFLWPDLKKKLRNYRPFLSFDTAKYIRALKERLLRVHDSNKNLNTVN